MKKRKQADQPRKMSDIMKEMLEILLPLFTFGHSIRCDCGARVDLAVGHQQTSEGVEQVSQQATMPRSADQRREEEVKLLAAIKDALPRLERLGKQANIRAANRKRAVACSLVPAAPCLGGSWQSSPLRDSLCIWDVCRQVCMATWF
jgi:hypothetical protein